ncbi:MULTISPECIES: hypothetical protein [unclassified Sphingomonas]|jgi:hypothetical protein|uniref:hypothetical protein n=1 Tax=unclassified Sphingomonas TaxID=196159 RepID=UPI000E10CCA3|nr:MULTISPECIES: hypothetical protein [unclassified Sphingomonas]AXJ94231.1 hypothetical protein DM480_00690 [Sphingomonas sp. FARSPH]
MLPEHFFFLMMGVGLTLAVQWYGRRKVRQAIAGPDVEARRDIQLLDAENTQRIGQIDRLQERLATVERIVTDRSHMLDREIERLR